MAAAHTGAASELGWGRRPRDWPPYLLGEDSGVSLLEVESVVLADGVVDYVDAEAVGLFGYLFLCA